MQEIKIKNNTSGLKIFINGIPDIKAIESEQLNIIVSALEKQVDDYFKTKRKNKNKSQKDLLDTP